ncbi:MAG TPA: nitroreductase family protein [Candidatus Aminicenantes bacterium]|nr:nitroreductase family protein [Candidatus Aminicenantes bacterium]
MKRENAGKVALGGIAAVLLLAFAAGLAAEEPATIKLNPPSLKRGLPLMEALAVRASVREYADRDLSLQDLSDLLWAADGLSRPAENKSTAPSAMNAHDVRIYVFMRTGAFLYDQQKHELAPVLAGDLRPQIVMARPPRPAGAPPPGAPAAPPAPAAAAPGLAPVDLILVSDGDRFRHGGPEQKAVWGALDAGIVSQNISLFCAATGLKTCPKASVNKEKIKELLKLTDAQVVFLDHPVGYAK